MHQFYEFRRDLRELFPLALTPVGRRQFVRWLLVAGRHEISLTEAEIWAFVRESAGDPSHGLAATFLMNPTWQSKFPHGLTVFGREALLRWVRRNYRIRRNGSRSRPGPNYGVRPISSGCFTAHRPDLQALAPRLGRRARHGLSRPARPGRNALVAAKLVAGVPGDGFTRTARRQCARSLLLSLRTAGSDPLYGRGPGCRGSAHFLPRCAVEFAMRSADPRSVPRAGAVRPHAFAPGPRAAGTRVLSTGRPGSTCRGKAHRRLVLGAGSRATRLAAARALAARNLGADALHRGSDAESDAHPGSPDAARRGAGAIHATATRAFWAAG